MRSTFTQPAAMRVGCVAVKTMLIAALCREQRTTGAATNRTIGARAAPKPVGALPEEMFSNVRPKTKSESFIIDSEHQKLTIIFYTSQQCHLFNYKRVAVAFKH